MDGLKLTFAYATGKRGQMRPLIATSKRLVA